MLMAGQQHVDLPCGQFPNRFQVLAEIGVGRHGAMPSFRKDCVATEQHTGRAQLHDEADRVWAMPRCINHLEFQRAHPDFFALGEPTMRGGGL